MSDTSSNYATHADNTRGLVVGEHNIIYQYFQQPEHAHLASRHIGFIPLIADKTDGFVGRQFVFDALDDFLSRNKSGYFIVLGEPGIGKTALLAQLVKTRGYCHHFNVAAQNIRSPRQFLANACAQVIARYNLPHTFLPENATEDSNFLVQCLGEATANPANRPVVFVVDALDEAERQDHLPRVNILYLPPSLPEGVYIVVTSRPLENLKLQVTNEQTLFLEPSMDGNLLDIQTYIEAYLQSSALLRIRLTKWNVTEDVFTGALVGKSEGNFIYLRYVLPAIAENKFAQGTIDELPRGLRAYYQSHWSQMQLASPAEFDDVYAPIVCMLAVAREPVTVDQLQRWTAEERAKIMHALAQWREFLEEEVTNGDRKFMIYHTSFRDFLSEAVDLKRFDKMIAAYYLGLVKKQ